MSRLTLKVPDMSCGHCVSSVSDAVRGLPGVTEVDVDLESKLVEVDGDGVDVAPVEQAIRDAGYEAERA
ncbi:MAG TPA: heavy-metal-associated domain-containing protein [Solirubrobacterales bacterium]|nr:heavy-metal-associated domain-containing protein [Solirubrobacterales bacterium]